MTRPAAPLVTVVSFGYGHTDAAGQPVPPPAAHLTIDVRTHFRDPHVCPALRHLTAADGPVAEAVMSTPGVPALIDSAVAAVNAFRHAPAPGPVTVAVGCVGGRHRSAVIAAEIARRLGPAAALTHRDITRPVIGHGTAAGST
jgi:RNase adaptor protein for sRNA GlmZ degradation